MVDLRRYAIGVAVCTQCGRTKTLPGFYRRANGDVVQPCRSCVAARRGMRRRKASRE
jgi:hypothetical protein